MGTGTKKADLWRNPYPCHRYGFSWVQVQVQKKQTHGETRTHATGMGFHRYGYRHGQKYPWVTHAVPYLSPVSGIPCVRYPVCHLYNINSYCILSPPTTFSIPPISSYTIDHSLLYTYISLYHILSYSAYHPILHIAPYYISPPICISCITYCIQYLILLNICPHIYIVYHFYPHITYQHTNLLYIIYILYSSPTFFKK
jgi:hypothetical protein